MTNNTTRNTLLAIITAVTLGACSSAIGPDGYTYDPWEPVNRKVFAFNDTLDTTLLKPAAIVYDAVLPDPVQTGVSNFFGNMEDIGAVINSLLQLKFEQAAKITSRVINNTIYGLGGIFDVGTALGNTKIKADFSGTLAHYGVESGPYVVLPVLGPNTVRGTFGLAVDKLAFSSVYHQSDSGFAWKKIALKGINKRASLLAVERSVSDSITDRYTFVRDSWLQHRWAELNQGQRSDSQQEAIDAIFAEDQ